jgi:hypothetical protein
MMTRVNIKSDLLLIIDYHRILTGKQVKDYFDCEKNRSHGLNRFSGREISKGQVSAYHLPKTAVSPKLQYN